MQKRMKKIGLAVAFLLLLVCLFQIAAGADSYKLTVSVPDGNGTVTVSYKDELGVDQSETVETSFEVSLPVGANYTLRATPKNAGYEFDGWYSDETTRTSTSTSLENIPMETTGKTYFAKFKAKTFQITYKDPEKYSFPSGIVNTFVYDDAASTVTEPSRVGYTFAGWKLYIGDSTVGNEFNNTADLKIYTYPSNITLEPLWTPVKYQVVRWDYVYDAAKPDSLGEFLGCEIWTADMDSEVSGNDGGSKSYKGYTVYADLTDSVTVSNCEDYDPDTMPHYKTSGINGVYRYYVAEEYVIAYDYQTTDHVEISGGASLPTKYSFDQLTAIPNPERKGYAFLGWILISGGTESGEAKKDLILQPKTNDGEITLKAVWAANEYSLIYDWNGTDAADNEAIADVNHRLPTKYTYGVNPKVTSPARKGYTFAGWLLSNADGPLFDGQILETLGETVFLNYPGDLTLQAQWSAITYISADYLTETYVFEKDGTYQVPDGNGGNLTVVKKGDAYTVNGDNVSGVPIAEKSFGQTVTVLVMTALGNAEYEMTFAARPEAPAVPSDGITETETSVTVTGLEDGKYEYALLPGADAPHVGVIPWGRSASFTDMTPGTPFTLFVRGKATETSPAGKISFVNVNSLCGDVNESKAVIDGLVEPNDGEYVRKAADGLKSKLDILYAKGPRVGFYTEREALLAGAPDAIAEAREKDTQSFHLTIAVIALTVVVVCQLIAISLLLVSRSNAKNRLRSYAFVPFAPIAGMSFGIAPETGWTMVLILGILAVIFQIVLTYLLISSRILTSDRPLPDPVGPDDRDADAESMDDSAAAFAEEEEDPYDPADPEDEGATEEYAAPDDGNEAESLAYENGYGEASDGVEPDEETSDAGTSSGEESDRYDEDFAEYDDQIVDNSDAEGAAALFAEEEPDASGDTPEEMPYDAEGEPAKENPEDGQDDDKSFIDPPVTTRYSLPDDE